MKQSEIQDLTNKTLIFILYNCWLTNQKENSLKTRIVRLAEDYLNFLIQEMPKEGKALKLTLAKLKASSSCTDENVIQAFTMAKNSVELRFSSFLNKFMEGRTNFINLCNDFLKTASDFRAIVEEEKKSLRILAKESKSYNDTKPIFRIPMDVNLLIFSYLDRNDIKSLALTCTNFSNIIQKNPKLKEAPLPLNYRNPEIVVTPPPLLSSLTHYIPIKLIMKDAYIGAQFNSIIKWNKKGDWEKYNTAIGPFTCFGKLSGQRFMTGTEDGYVAIFNIHDKEDISVLTGHEGPVTAVAYLSSKNIASASEDNTLRVWNIENCEDSILTLTVNSTVIHLIALSPTLIVSASEDHIIRIWDIQTDEYKPTKDCHKGAITCLGNLPNYTFVSSSEDSTVRFWSAEGDCLKTLPIAEPVRSFTIFNTILAGYSQKNIYIWDIRTSELLFSKEIAEGTLTHMEIGDTEIYLFEGELRQHTITFNPLPFHSTKEEENPSIQFHA